MSATRKSRVLVVDDLETNRDLLKRRLLKRGFEVDAAESGPEALALVERTVFDIVLLDAMMPGMDGLEVLRHLRTRLSAALLPVIMVTAKNESEGIVLALQIGANDYVTKPVDMPVLLARMETQLARRRAELAVHEATTHLKSRIAERTRDLDRLNAELALEHNGRIEIEAELRASLNKAQAANAAKSKFIASVSREMKIPLNVVIGFAEVIRQQTQKTNSVAGCDEYATHIEESGRHLLGILNQVVEFTRAESGTIELAEDECRPNKLIADAVEMFVSDDNASDIRIVGAPADAKLIADAVLIKRCLANLLSNAIKFSARGMRIDVCAEINGSGDFVISVADHGRGMTTEQLARSFETFEFADRSPVQQHEGVGLGLPLTKALVQLHGGRLEIDSEPGVGTTASVILPCSRVVRLQRETCH